MLNITYIRARTHTYNPVIMAVCTCRHLYNCMRLHQQVQATVVYFQETLFARQPSVVFKGLSNVYGTHFLSTDIPLTLTS